MLDVYIDIIAFAAAIVVGPMPRRLWPRFERWLPLGRAACASGVATLAVGYFAGFSAFLRFAARTADANNRLMLAQLATPGSDAAALMPYGISVVTFLLFLFTPMGLLSTYLVVSGLMRAASAWVDDPHGDFLLSGLAWMVEALADKNRIARVRAARERLEGPDAPDVLRTGQWAGLDVDYIVLAARRKAEWQPGAIIMTSSDWYRLGAPLDVETPAGLRAAYPLKKLESVEVVRRGIQYELPHLAKDSSRRRTIARS